MRYSFYFPTTLVFPRSVKRCRRFLPCRLPHNAAHDLTLFLNTTQEILTKSAKHLCIYPCSSGVSTVILSRMIRIYQAADLPEAHLVAGLLCHAGIDARVLKENAQGGLGDIPFGEAYPEVWIEQSADFDRANAIIEEFERPAMHVGYVVCPACGEDSPGNFELCWKCGARF